MSCSQHLQHASDREISLQHTEIFPDPDSGVLWTLSLLLAAEIKCCAESKRHWELSEAKVFALPCCVCLRKSTWDFTTKINAVFLSWEPLHLICSIVSAGQCSTECKMLHKGSLLSAPAEGHLSRGVASSQVTHPPRWHVLPSDTSSQVTHPPQYHVLPSAMSPCTSACPPWQLPGRAFTLKYPRPRGVWNRNLGG